MDRTLFVFILLSLIAEIIGTIGGFGSSVYFVPIASFFLDFEKVLGLTALFHLASNLSKIFLFKKGIDSQLLIWLGLPSIVFVLIGSFLTSYFDARILSLSLNVFLILFSIFLLIKQNLTLRPSKTNGIIGGMLSGFTAGLLGTGGAIRGLTMASYNLPIEKFIATSAVIDLGVDFSRSVIYFQKGYITPDIYQKALILLVISIIGSYLGKRILTHFSQASFRAFSIVSVLIIGLIGLFNSARHFIK